MARGFGQLYGLHAFAGYEGRDTVESAIVGEKAIKGWKRVWQIVLRDKWNRQRSDLRYA